MKYQELRQGLLDISYYFNFFFFSLNNVYFLQFWMLKSPRSGLQQIQCVVRAVFLVCEWLSSYIFTWQRAERDPPAISSVCFFFVGKKKCSLLGLPQVPKNIFNQRSKKMQNQRKSQARQIIVCVCVQSVAESSLTLCNPRLLCPWNFPGKNTGVYFFFFF